MWVAFCFLVIVGLFIVYAMDQLPGVLAPQSRSASPDGIGEDPDKSGQVKLQAEEVCSPCEENLKRLKEAIERWKRERNA